MKHILVAYHSGTGGTRLVAELICQSLASRATVRLWDVTTHVSPAELEAADGFVFAFPTFYLKPSPSITEALERIPRQEHPRPAYVLTTVALYSENCLRLFCRSLLAKQIFPVGSVQLRSPASDVSLLMSKAPRAFFRFERGIHRKISRLCASLIRALEEPTPRVRIPWIKWYTPLTQLAQILVFDDFKKVRHQLKVVPARCSSCGLCVNSCSRGCWSAATPHPHIEGENCELCLRCVHHCPGRAIIWNTAMQDRPRLTPALYRSLAASLGQAITPSQRP